MSIKVFVPRDSAAISVGADFVANKLANLDDIELIRNGSRGLFWLEPMVEVDSDQGRIAYGPVSAGDLESLLAAGMLEGKQDHDLCLGQVDDIPYLAKQQRLTFERAGIIDPTSLEDYQAHNGYLGAYAGAVVRPSRLVSNGKPCSIQWASKNTSFAMPTKATRALLQIACRWRPTHLA